MKRMEKLEQIKKLAEIRNDVEHGSYLNPFKARDHLRFLLLLCDELSESLRAIQKINKEVVRNADAAG